MKIYIHKAYTPTAFLRLFFFLYNIQEDKFFRIEPLWKYNVLKYWEFTRSENTIPYSSHINTS